MLNNNYICALDIGASKLSGCLAQIKKRQISNLFFEMLPSSAIKKGVVVNSLDLVNAVSTIVGNLKVKAGVNIRSLYVNLSGSGITTKHSRAIIPLAERGNKVINMSDIQKVNEQARILGSSLEDEILHQVPLGYAIDSSPHILNPLGLYSHRLEVDLYLVCAKLSSLQNISRIINQAGYDIKDLFFSGLASSDVISSKEIKDGVSIFCDIGSDISEILVFEEGRLKSIEVLNTGGNDLTEQLSEELKIPFELAEDIKRSYASLSDAEGIPEDKEILVKKDNVYKPIKQKLVCQILTNKTILLCQQIKHATEKLVTLGKVSHFIVGGRTILLDGFLEMLENSLSTPVKLARITNPELAFLAHKYDALAGQKYFTYVTALGLVCRALDNERLQFISSYMPAVNPVLKVINKARAIYQEYF